MSESSIAIILRQARDVILKRKVIIKMVALKIFLNLLCMFRGKIQAKRYSEF